MTIEQQTISLDLAKRLKALNVKQESLFWWQEYTQNEWKIIHHSAFDGIRNGVIKVDGYETIKRIAENGDDAISAFTTSELIDMLPKEYDDGIVYWEISDQSQTGIPEWVVRSYDFSLAYDAKEMQAIAETLPDALGGMLAYLLEEEIITTENL